MQLRTLYKSFVLILFIALFVGCTYGQKQKKPGLIKGVYGSPAALWEKGYTLQGLGINSIFVHSGALTSKIVQRAKSEGAMVFVEFPTLNGKGYVEDHQEAWAINEKGEKVEAASWFMGVCPTDYGFRKYRMNQLQQLLNDFEIDGVWMDYVHWHAQFEDPQPILPETCFSDSCIQAFSKDAQIQIPKGTTSEKAAFILEKHESEWRNWRCEVVFNWTKEMRSIVKKKSSNILLGLYHCPWTDGEFKNARKRILGLDFSLLKQSIDVFSPMVYHERMGRTQNWVEENVGWLCDEIDVKKNGYPKVWPIVQAHNDPGNVSAEEFEVVLKGGLAGKSSGVMMFTANAVAEDAEKIESMKNIYRSEYTHSDPK